VNGYLGVQKSSSCPRRQRHTDRKELKIQCHNVREEKVINVGSIRTYSMEIGAEARFETIAEGFIRWKAGEGSVVVTTLEYFSSDHRRGRPETLTFAKYRAEQ